MFTIVYHSLILSKFKCWPTNYDIISVNQNYF